MRWIMKKKSAGRDTVLCGSIWCVTGRLSPMSGIHRHNCLCTPADFEKDCDKMLRYLTCQPRVSRRWNTRIHLSPVLLFRLSVSLFCLSVCLFIYTHLLRLFIISHIPQVFHLPLSLYFTRSDVTCRKNDRLRSWFVVDLEIHSSRHPCVVLGERYSVPDCLMNSRKLSSFVNS